MPSNQDPSTVVQPGNGKLAAGEVPASAISFPIGGSGDLQAHILNPVDAHMSGAIGIPDVYPPTGEPLRSIVGGPYDGESVLDALNSLKDLLPVKPNRIGFSNPVPNSGTPNWTNALNSAIHAGWTKASVGIVSQYVNTAAVAGTINPSGICYPADRGVLAVYKTTSGDYFDTPNVTLLAALWLGANPPPGGVPGAAFDASIHNVNQVNYTPTNSGIDFITLTNRLPYLQSYAPYGNVYSNYTTNFFTYQLATYSFPVSLVAEDAGSFLLVHWHEQYATTLAAIQPAGLTALTLIPGNCYSATPADGSSVFAAINRRNIFLDSSSGVAPTAGAISTAPVGTVTTRQLSGVTYYNSNGLEFNTTATANNIFRDSYFTNNVASLSVPSGFESSTTPASADTSDFGGSVTAFELYDGGGSNHIFNNAGSVAYTLLAPPATTDVIKFQHGTLPIAGSGTAVPYPYGQVRVVFHKTFNSALTMTDATKYLYNGVANTGSSATSEAFTDEQYRYISTYTASSATVPLIPAGGDVYSSSSPITAGTSDIQLLSGRIVYPQTNFSTGYEPSASQPNYATVLSGDASNHIRFYVRAFNTGIARNTGHLTINGLAFSTFDAGLAAIDPTMVADHPGGAIVQIKVPGATGWLDLGRAKGQPSLSTADFFGCRTGIAGPVYAYDTTAFTSNNGSGSFLIFVRIGLIKNGTGQTLTADSLVWAP